MLEIAVALLVVSIVVPLILRGRTKTPVEPPAAVAAPELDPVYLEMRALALSGDRADLELDTALEGATVWGVVMETGDVEGITTLVAWADGRANLHFSGGGGVTGVVGHQSLRAAAIVFTRAASHHLPDLQPAPAVPFPDVGRVRFYALTDAGIHTAEAAAHDLDEQRHELAPLFHAGHRVITQLRLASETS
jgi:hypothetical protein